MQRSRKIAVLSLILALFLSSPALTAVPASTSRMTQTAARVPIRLAAATGDTVLFKTQNGYTTEAGPAQTTHIPHLVLLRNGALTSHRERTLTLEIPDLDVPPLGIDVTVFIETQHPDPDAPPARAQRMRVWERTLTIPNRTGRTQRGVAAAFTITFDAYISQHRRLLRTPTGYFRYTVVTAHAGGESVLHTVDYAFLLENQAVAALPPVLETRAGAAPDELLIHYCDMFPVAVRTSHGVEQLRRAEVTAFVRAELLPRFVEAFRTQTNVWGFPWYPAWTPYRKSVDAERLSVALTDDRTWFHGRAPTGAHTGISINVGLDGGGFRYSDPADRIVSYFAHELFHSLQHNLALHWGGSHTTLDGKDERWEFFSEGTAVLATSVGEQRTEFQEPAGAYHVYASKFIGGGGLWGYLNASYGEVSPYSAAIYWRFLYEQCGGMDVVRGALITLYSGEIVDLDTSTQLITHLPAIMDQALDRGACPFETYEGSLAAFARALYTLHLEDNREFYDPHRLYPAPTVTTLHYTGSPLTYGPAAQQRPQGIPSSYGMDFLKIDFSEDGAAGPVTVSLSGAARGKARFTLEVLSLMAPGTILDSRRVRLTSTTSSITIPAAQVRNAERLGVIITRIDSQEAKDPIGAYTLKVCSTAKPCP